MVGINPENNGLKRMTIGRTHLQMLHSSYLKEIAEQVLDLLEQRRCHFPLPDFSGPELDEEVNPIEADQVEVCGRKRNLFTREFKLQS